LNKLFRVDLLDEDLVVVEAKAVEQEHPIHLAQCLTHLRITEKRLPLVINFGRKFVKDGVHRVVHGLSDA
jgi:GxxExxY protein